MTNRLAARLVFLAIAGAAGIAAATCKNIQGQIHETAVPPADCRSLFGICTTAQITGNIKGNAQFTATLVIPSGDTPVTGVVFVTGDVTVSNVEFNGKFGTLSIKSAAAVRNGGSWDIVDNQTIIGGTGDFSLASGSLRLTGTFLNGSGTSHFDGSLCVP